MSTVTPAATSRTTAPLAISPARAAIVSAVLALGAVAVAVAVLWQPWGERNQIGYADVAPHRDAAWLGTVVNGLGFAAVGIALGLAPRWLPVGYLVLTVGLFALRGVALSVLQAVQTLSLLAVAFYTLRAARPGGHAWVSSQTPRTPV